MRTPAGNEQKCVTILSEIAANHHFRQTDTMLAIIFGAAK